jgi:hypothetical protein
MHGVKDMKYETSTDLLFHDTCSVESLSVVSEIKLAKWRSKYQVVCKGRHKNYAHLTS